MTRSFRKMAITSWGLLLCAWGLYWIQCQWRYERAFDREDFRAAVRIWPENASGWRWLSLQFGQPSDQTIQEARTAVHLAPEDWQNWSALATNLLQADDIDGARQAVEAMAVRAHTFQAHWQFASFLLVTGDSDGYWRQTAYALALAEPNQLSALLHALWIRDRGPEKHLKSTVDLACRLATSPTQPFALQSSLFYLDLDHQEWEQANAIWQGMLRLTPPAPQAGLSQATNVYLRRLITAGQADQLEGVLSQIGRDHLLSAKELPSASNLLVNGAFDNPLGQNAFDWQLCTTCSAFLYRNPIHFAPGSPFYKDQSALAIEFHGVQAITKPLARQPVLLLPGTAYTLKFVAQREDSHPETGVTVRIANASNQSCASVVLPGGSEARSFTLPFETRTGGASLYEVQILYQRPQGQIPLRGTQLITGFTLTGDTPSKTSGPAC